MITVRELGWAPGSYQWECTKCHAIGNITPRMITVPSTEWHISALPMNAISNLVLCHRCWRRQKIRNGRIAKHKWHAGTCPGSGERI